MKLKAKNVLNQLLILTKHFSRQMLLLSQLRSFWTWILIFYSLFFYILYSIIPTELFWATYGVLAGVWLTKAFDDKILFVRSYGDSAYIINDHLIYLTTMKLDDRIFFSLFGGSLSKVIVVYPMTIAFLKWFKCQPFKLSLGGAMILRSSGQNTKYLKFTNSKKIHAFPDYETYKRFVLWAKIRNKDILITNINSEELTNSPLGSVLSSFNHWTDADVLTQTNKN